MSRLDWLISDLREEDEGGVYWQVGRFLDAAHSHLLDKRDGLPVMEPLGEAASDIDKAITVLTRLRGRIQELDAEDWQAACDTLEAAPTAETTTADRPGSESA